MVLSEDVIEIHLKTAEQLFNSLDPSPFHERDLDREAESYIVGLAREFKNVGPLRLIVTLPELAYRTKVARHIPEAIHNYFSYRILQSQRELRELLRIGWRSLVIGLVILLFCFVTVQYFDLAKSQTTLGVLTEQSLVIFGWVANWRPLEIFLYDWWPIRRHLVLLHRLAGMSVEVRSASAPDLS